MHGYQTTAPQREEKKSATRIFLPDSCQDADQSAAGLEFSLISFALTMTPSLEQHAFTCLAHKLALGGTFLHTWPLNGGSSARMDALEIAQADGMLLRVVVRQPGAAALARNPYATRNEYQLLVALHEQGILVPRPLLFDETGSCFPTPVLALEYIDGAADFAPSDPIGTAHQLAAQLTRIHQMSSAAPGIENLQLLPAVLGPPAATALEQAHIRAAIANTWPPPQMNTPTLLHGDYWPGNVLWRDMRLVAIIDWEDAGLGDPLRDLAIARLDLLWIYGHETMQIFTRTYCALQPLNYASLPHWDLFAALRLARLVGSDLDEWAAFFQPFGRADITAQHIRAHYDWFVAQALRQLSQKQAP